MPRKPADTHQERHTKFGFDLYLALHRHVIDTEELYTYEDIDHIARFLLDGIIAQYQTTLWAIPSDIALPLNQFLQELHHQQDSPLGDLANDLANDPQAPNQATLREYLNFLMFKNAHPIVAAVLLDAWHECYVYIHIDGHQLAKTEPVR